MKLITFPSVGFPKICWTVKHIFVPFLIPVEKKNGHKTKFEIEEEHTKLQIARKLPLFL